MNQRKRKSYIKPVLCQEEFIPSSYVAACVAENGETQFYLCCTEEYQAGVMGEGHTDDGCHRPEAFTVTLNEDKTIKSIYENPNNSGWWNQGGYADNIQVNGQSAALVPLTDLNGSYELTWDTHPGWTTMGHSGTLTLSTAVNVNMS